MRIVDILLREYTHEAAQTRKVLERVPADKGDWKPHEKSMALGKLAVHLADLASWTTLLTTTELNFADGYDMPTFTTTEALLAIFDKNVEEGKKALMAAKDEELGAPGPSAPAIRCSSRCRAVNACAACVTTTWCTTAVSSRSTCACWTWRSRACTGHRPTRCS